MTNVQTKSLKIWGLIIWTALWCWVYAANQGKPIQYFPEGELSPLLFCLAGWFIPWLPIGMWLLMEAKHERSGGPSPRE